MRTLVTILPCLSMGGAEHMAYELIRNVDSNKYRHVVVCYGQKMNTPLEIQMEKICKVVYLGIHGSIGICAMARVLGSINKEKPDIIHAHMGGVTFGIPYSRLAKVPLVLTVHTKPEKAFSRRNESAIRSYLVNKRFCLVAVSQENLDSVRDYFGNVGKCICINNGVDIHRYQKQSHQPFTFINVARQDENKNQIAIIQAFEKMHRKIPETKLLLVGDGPCHESLIETVENMGLSNCVEFTGMVADPTPLYNRSDIYVQSSHREAMPLSALEGMAAGLPVISTRVGGMCDIVKENGFLIEDNESIVDSLCAAMAEMYYMDQDCIRKMVQASKEIVKAFSSEEMANKYVSIYEELLCQ